MFSKKKFIILAGILFVVWQKGWADVPVVEASSNYQADAAGISNTSVQKSNAPISFSKNDHSSTVNGQEQILSSEERIAKLERQMENLNQIGFTKRIDNLDQQIQKINGKVELQTHQIEQLSEQLKSFYQDLNQRITKAKNAENVGETFTNEVKQAPEVQTTGVSLVSKPKKKETKNTKNHNQTTTQTAKNAAENPEEGFSNSNDLTTGDAHNSSTTARIPSTSNKSSNNNPDQILKDQQTYQDAFDFLQHKDYGQAVEKLQAYITNFPKGIYAANAHYWLGEVSFLQDHQIQAGIEFKNVIDKFPHSTKVPDAILKLALIHENQGKHAQAKAELNEVIKKYPKSAAAHLATQQLQDLN